MVGMDLDSFLGHSSSARVGKVVNWKKRKPPQIDTWLHTKSSIIALWRHGFPRLVERKVDGNDVVEIWGGNFNCWESEDVLKRQYKRNDDGSRLAPPQVCPMCLLLEYLQQEVRAERLSWTDEIFSFEGDDATRTLHVGGMFNAFGGDKLSREEIAELKAAGIKRTDAWQENGMAKCSYVFSIVDNDEIDKGVQTAIETTALGDAVKKTIRDQIEAMGGTAGHPMKDPYIIRWQYREAEVEFSKKYNSLALPKVHPKSGELMLTEEIRALIIDSPAPDLGPTIARGNAGGLRAVMERHALIDLPFDKIFGPAEKIEGVRKRDEDEPSEAEADEPAPAPRQRAAAKAPPAPPAKAEAPAPRRRAPAAPTGPVEPPRPAGAPVLPCDKCGARMLETEVTCWKCGAKYEIDEPAKPQREPGDDSDENDAAEAGASFLPGGDQDVGF